MKPTLANLERPPLLFEDAGPPGYLNAAAGEQVATRAATPGPAHLTSRRPLREASKVIGIDLLDPIVGYPGSDPTGRG